MTVLIYYYVKKIIFFLVFTSFLQILFLNNNYKKYLQLVLNLILIFIMLDPLLDIYNSISKGNLDEYIQIAEEADFSLDEDTYIEIQNQIVLDLFEENIRSQTQNIIGNGYTILDFDLTLVEDKNYQTVIKNMSISLSKESEKTVYVKPFSFSTNTAQDENYDNEYAEEIKNLKILISNFYNLSFENIFITII